MNCFDRHRCVDLLIILWKISIVSNGISKSVICRSLFLFAMVDPQKIGKNGIRMKMIYREKEVYS